MIWIGLDDTDVLTSRGTGHLAREIAQHLRNTYNVLGVTRHQLLLDPRVRYTKKNSSAALMVGAPPAQAPHILDLVKSTMMAAFVPGSDPGLCVTTSVPPIVTAFGRRTQQEVVQPSEARGLAETQNIMLIGLGGDESGVIGALAAVGLAASGDDGRYIWVGRIRELSGLQRVDTVLDAGVAGVQTLDGTPVTTGLIDTDKLRPARQGHRPIAVVTWHEDHWLPLKLD